MRINPDRLRSLRKKQKLSIAKLAEKTKRVDVEQTGITEKTIQRIERQSSQTAHEHTVECLAKALDVEAGVLTDELPLPDVEGLFTDDSGRGQINVQIGPKIRLAYDLIRERYDVNTTNLVSMAPLFFALLASGSLAWRKEKLKGVKEAIKSLKGNDDNEWDMFARITLPQENMAKMEDESISKEDIFGEVLAERFRRLLVSMRDDVPYPAVAAMRNVFGDEQSADPILSQDEWADFLSFAENEEWAEFYRSASPFVQYLRKLARENTDEIKVESGDLWSKYPDYIIFDNYINRISNNSPMARKALEFGHARLSEIPDALQAEDAGEKREKWLKEKLWGGLHGSYGQAANNSLVAQIALEFGYARLSEIPDALQAEDAGEKREKWLKEKLPDELLELMAEPRRDVLGKAEREKRAYENWWKAWETAEKKRLEESDAMEHGDES